MKAGSEVNFTRVLDAPRTLVFRMWTDPKHFAEWWGPHKFTNPTCELDVRPGGAIRVEMRGPDGKSRWMPGEFREVDAPRRLVFTTISGDPASPSIELLNTITFEEDGKTRTRLSLTVRVLRVAPEMEPYIEGMNAGFTQSLEKLAAHLVAAGDAR